MPKSKKRNEEHEIQCAWCNWMDLEYPTLKYHSIPNGGVFGPARIAHFYAEGMRGGVPDIAIPELLLYIEFKKPKGGRLGPKQKEWLDYINAITYGDVKWNAVVVKSLEEAQNAVLEKLRELLA